MHSIIPTSQQEYDLSRPAIEGQTVDLADARAVRRFSAGMIISLFAHLALLAVLWFCVSPEMSQFATFSGRQHTTRIELISTSDEPIPAIEPIAMPVEAVSPEVEVTPRRPAPARTQSRLNWPEITQVAMREFPSVERSPECQCELRRDDQEEATNRTADVSDPRKSPQRRLMQQSSLPRVVIEQTHDFGLDDRSPPTLLDNSEVKYPVEAISRRLEGVVYIQLEVKIDGSVGQAVVVRSSGYAILDRAALNTVQGWRFRPAMQSGQAVATTEVLPVRFHLER